MDDGVGGTEEAEQELLAALAPVEENKATDAENPPLQTGPPLFMLCVYMYMYRMDSIQTISTWAT